MTTMIEKAAKAAYLAYGGYDDWDTHPDEGSVYDGIFRNDIRKMARAALTALLEPSEAMVLAGNIALSDNGVCDIDNDDSKVCVVAAIQAALDEKEGV